MSIYFLVLRKMIKSKFYPLNRYMLYIKEKSILQYTLHIIIKCVAVNYNYDKYIRGSRTCYQQRAVGAKIYKYTLE